MAKKQDENLDKNLESIESSLTRTEQFIEKNQKVLIMVVVGVLAIVGIIVAYQRWYAEPKEIEAKEKIYVAEDYFQRDSFNLALNGDGNYPGFLEIIDDYSSTNAGNLARYYAGVSYYRLDKYDEAIKLLNEFKTDDKIIGPVAKGCIGDAYSQKKEFDKAVQHYLEAANMSDNNFTAPVYLMKAGRVYESQNNWKSALEVYERVKKEFKTSMEARTIDKYITRAKMSM